MNTETYETVPDVLNWQGQDVFLAEIKQLANIAGSPTRYVYVDRAGLPKVMQFDFGQGIDWQNLEAANSAAPCADTEKQDRRLSKWRLYSKSYLSKATSHKYDEFIKWLEEQGNA